MKGTGVVLDGIVESGSAISVLFRVELTHALQARANRGYGFKNKEQRFLIYEVRVN
jgi:hypothetical protein